MYGMFTCIFLVKHEKWPYEQGDCFGENIPITFGETGVRTWFSFSRNLQEVSGTNHIFFRKSWTITEKKWWICLSLRLILYCCVFKLVLDGANKNLGPVLSKHFQPTNLGAQPRIPLRYFGSLFESWPKSSRHAVAKTFTPLKINAWNIHHQDKSYKFLIGQGLHYFQ